MHLATRKGFVWVRIFSVNADYGYQYSLIRPEITVECHLTGSNWIVNPGVFPSAHRRPEIDTSVRCSILPSLTFLSASETIKHIEMASPTDIRKGRVIEYNNIPHSVLEVLHRTQGRQAGFVQVTLRNLVSRNTTTTKLRSTDSVDILSTDTQKLEFSYVDAEGYHFLHPETFEDTTLNKDLIKDSLKFLAEGNTYEVLYVEGRAVQIQLPASVEMPVTEAAPAIRGDTSGAALKPVTIETGLVVQTPLFIKTGDVIRVSTFDGSYLGRV